ncbi:MAG: hypothetical protein AUG06_02870 [Actinobacteria bacterium 13_1_20CM_2_65_11]|nr:MAG: hypothetical protein AUJ02_08780 [Chloroflexi bacterium 13_1_40CM_3_65_12]OLD50258.1 MAG: hypothetical protein AUI42_04080 [Actinobacteria bacterium 13_1_40CM_2_65_8]OLE80903.1 MAG: hypothetical protein AUG06_02870 [Actinobacteria bacterium 13_1_20CM_2_65_11]
MSDNDDLELQALQRQLDDAFETTRPRSAFEDELWSKMQARRPLWTRIVDVFTGLFEAIRAAPAVPAAAAAVVLILAIGIGVFSAGGVHFGGGASTTSSQAGGAQYNGAFGRLPAPALQPVPIEDTGGPKAAAPAQQSGTNLYLGPARLVWAGQLSVATTSAPVFRYEEPTALDADRFATALGASPAGRTPGTLGVYTGDGFVLAVSGSKRQPLAEPTFSLTPDRSRLPAPGPTEADTAAAFLTAHSAVPAWPSVDAVEQIGDVTQVRYLRQFAVPGYGFAYLVNQWGVRYGLAVDLRGGQPLQATGPLPVNLATANYSIISADQAVRSALASSPSAPSAAPTIRLTSAELVYALASAGDHSFYEPAFLFSGTFTQNGSTFTKRVLVPAVGPQ